MREAATICPRPMLVDLLTLKVVSESRVTWATSVPILVFLGLSVLDLGPMYTRQTDVRQTDVRRAASLYTSAAQGCRCVAGLGGGISWRPPARLQLVIRANVFAFSIDLSLTDVHAIIDHLHVQGFVVLYACFLCAFLCFYFLCLFLCVCKERTHTHTHIYTSF